MPCTLILYAPDVMAARELLEPWAPYLVPGSIRLTRRPWGAPAGVGCATWANRSGGEATDVADMGGGYEVRAEMGR